MSAVSSDSNELIEESDDLSDLSGSQPPPRRNSKKRKVPKTVAKSTKKPSKARNHSKVSTPISIISQLQSFSDLTDGFPELESVESISSTIEFLTKNTTGLLTRCKHLTGEREALINENSTLKAEKMEKELHIMQLKIENQDLCIQVEHLEQAAENHQDQQRNEEERTVRRLETSCSAKKN